MRAGRAHTWCLACLSTVLLALPTAMSAARMQMTDVAKGYRMRRDIGQVWRNFHASAHRHEHVVELALPLGRRRCLTPLGQRHLRTFLEDYVGITPLLPAHRSGSWRH